MAQHLLEVLLSVPQVVELSGYLLANRPGISEDDVFDVVATSLRGGNVGNIPGACSKVLTRLMTEVADPKSRALAFEAMMASRTEGETAAILRLLSGLDKNLHVDGAGIGDLRVENTGKYNSEVTRRVLNVATLDECCQLLEDAHVALGKVCARLAIPHTCRAKACLFSRLLQSSAVHLRKAGCCTMRFPSCQTPQRKNS